MLQRPSDAEQATAKRREDAIPTTLPTLLLQYLSTLALPSAPRPDTMTPAALRDDLLRQANAHVPSTKALRTLVEQLLQDRTVLDAIQRVLDTARMSNAGELSGAAGGTEASTVPHTEAEGKPLPYLDGCQMVPQGTVFLASQAPKSLDSRYFNAVPLTAIAATAVPLWTWR